MNMNTMELEGSEEEIYVSGGWQIVHDGAVLEKEWDRAEEQN